jgi:DNA-binding transcriptional regulator YhcF (GntR family)
MELSGTRHKAARSLQLATRPFEVMRESFVQQKRNDEQETEKAPFLVVQKIQDAILDETFKPGERLPETGLGEMFKVSRSPVREALFALESEGTVIMESYKGAILKPLSPEEALDIAELRLALISLAAKPAYRHLSPADFDSTYGLAKQVSPIFLRPEVKFLLLVNPGSGTDLLPAPEKRCHTCRLRVRRALAKPHVKQIEFACECVVQITIHSQITQVLLLFQWKAGIGLRIRQDIE